MGSRDTSPIAVTTTRLRREDCGRTKHDSAFSDWKVLIGPSDWEDYAVGKEGAGRYRVHNLPASSSPGLYELGAAISHTKSGREIKKLNPSNIIVVYIGQADCVRTRLQHYGRTGSHLGNVPSSTHENQKTCTNEPGLFSDILSRSYSIVFRWTPMINKEAAVSMETLLLDTFDYAWNKSSNGARRPHDIIQKLEEASSTTYRVSSIAKNLLPFLQKKVGIRIQNKLPSPEKQNDLPFEEKKGFLPAIFKFSRSHPRVVLDRSRIHEDGTGFCGVYFGDGNICRMPPVKGRKRCTQHKGMKANIQSQSVDLSEQVFTDQGLNDLVSHPKKVQVDLLNLPATESFTPAISGVSLGDGNICRTPPVKGRKRCALHKGMRTNIRPQDLMPHHPLNLLGTRSFTPVTCGFILGDGSSCRKPPARGRKRCSEHKGRRIVAIDVMPCQSPGVNCEHKMGQNIPNTIVIRKIEAQFLPKKSDPSNNPAICGVDHGDGTFCARQPARGRVRCNDHKGMRVRRA
ncbi:hypothetical protein SAY87_022439 [Trapa incisa]|uniref:Protein EFFECTOR OF TRANSCRIPTION 2-like n=1 Tax=Trapa incisa TaxID=236973 RepID=A0AAN7K7T2_9MYRT|nr:hypothetical protein SAY87_022439 [Trapa incisa]